MTVSGIFAVPFAPNTHTTSCAWFSLKDRAVEVISRAFCALRATLESPELTVWEKAFQCRQFAVYTAHLGMTKQQLKQITRSVLSSKITPYHFQTTLTESGNRLFRNGSSAWDLHQLWTRVEEKLQGRAPPFFIEVCQEARARLQEHLRQNRQEAISCFYRGLTYWIIVVSYNHSLELSLLEYFREIVPTELYLEASTVVKRLAELLQTKATTLTPNERQQACKQACRDLDQIFFPASYKPVDQAALQRAGHVKHETLLHLISRVALSCLILQNRSYASRHSFIGSAAVGWVFIPGVSAAGTAQGLEFLVNKFEGPSSDLDPAAALLPNGEVIVVWHMADQDFGTGGIFGLKYASTGEDVQMRYSGANLAVGNEFPVNSYLLGNQFQPTIAALNNGEVVIAWTSDGQDGDGNGVFGTWIHQNGTFKITPTMETGGSVGYEFPLNTFTTGDQWKPTLAALPGGGFVCAWMSNGQDGDSTGIYGKWFHSNGTERFIPTSGIGGALGAEFRVNTYTPDFQSYPSLSYHDDGGFYATWRGYNPTLGLFDIFAKRFAANGSELTLPTSGLGGATGNEFRVNIYTADIQTSPKIIYHSARGPLITWYSNQQEGPTEAQGIYGIRYNSSGGEVMVPHSGRAGAVGSEFHVNNRTLKDQMYPIAIPLVNGGDVVAWESEDQDGDDLGVFGMMYNADGAEVRVATSGMSGAVGNEFRINTYIWGHQHNIALVPTQDGGFLAFWDSGARLYGKRFAANGSEVPLQTDSPILPGVEPTTPSNTTATPPSSTTPPPVAPVTSGPSGSDTKVIPLVAGLLGAGAGIAAIAVMVALVYRRRHRSEPTGLSVDESELYDRSQPAATTVKDRLEEDGYRVLNAVRSQTGHATYAPLTTTFIVKKEEQVYLATILDNSALSRFKESEEALKDLQQIPNLRIDKLVTSDNGVSGYRLVPIKGRGNGVTLSKILQENRRTEQAEQVFLKTSIDILEGVNSMHKIGYCHGNLAPENVLIDENGAPLIINFGSVSKVKDNQQDIEAVQLALLEIAYGKRLTTDIELKEEDANVSKDILQVILSLKEKGIDLVLSQLRSFVVSKKPLRELLQGLPDPAGHTVVGVYESFDYLIYEGSQG